MRTRLLFPASVLVLLMTVFLTTPALGQELVCSMTEGETEGVGQVLIGGRFRTSTGVLRVLVVFVRFKDDIETTSSWPDTNALPYWAANFVDSSVSTIGSTDTRNLSTYFYENSYGKLKVIGDVYYVTTDNNESYYHNYSFSDDAIRGRLNREILLKLDGAPYNLNFTRYDKWVDPSEYSHTYSEGGDAKIDMIWMITRNYHDVETKFGRAAADFQVEGGSLTLDGVTIYHTANTMSVNSSGITLFGPNMSSPRYIYDPSAPTGVTTLVGTMAHEMSHYFFGGGHLGGVYIATRRWDSIFSGYSGNAGNCFSHYLGYEKYRLGWLSPTEYTSNTDNVVLYDLATTTDSTKDRLLRIPISGTNQCFLIENRRWISNFETHYSPYNLSHAVLSPGIIIYHIISENSELPSTRSQIRSADGRFVWKFVQDTDPSTQSDDVIDKDSADFVNGYDERERIYFPNKPASQTWRAAYIPGSNERWYPNATNYRDATTDISDDTGDRFDVFDVGYVVNPWSNPGSHSWNSQSSTFSQTTIGVEVTGFNSTTQAYTLSIRVSNPEDLSPSKPQNLRGSYAGNGQVNLTWTPNGEPDTSQYRIYRDGQLVQTVSRPPASDPVTPNAQTVVYAIKARDTQGKESVFSDPISILLPPAAPSLASPSNGATGVSTSPTLSWNASNGATSYRLQVSWDSGFSYVIFDDSTITTTSRQVGPLQNNTGYWWRVKAKNAVGPGNWSSAWSFMTVPAPPPVPALSWPLNGATGISASQVVLYWNSSTGASSYRLQVSTSDSFSTCWQDQSWIMGTSISITGLSYSTTYYWHVNAAGNGGTSAYSATWSFTTEALPPPPTPTLLLPANGTTGLGMTATLSWNVSSGATSYRLQVSTSSGFGSGSIVWDASNITTTSQQVGPLYYSTTYYWRVNATGVGGTSDWSAGWSFTTASPSQLVLLSPLNGAANISFPAILRWTSWSADAGYELQVSLNPSFSPTVVDQWVGHDTSFTVYGLGGTTLYYWRVMAWSKYAGNSPWSSTWNFTTAATPVCDAPTPPSWLTASWGLHGCIILNWGAGNAPCGMAGYRVYCRDYCGTTWWQLAFVPPTQLGFALYPWYGYSCANTYVFRITTMDNLWHESPPSPEATGQMN